jgi:hypothetical protein
LKTVRCQQKQKTALGRFFVVTQILGYGNALRSCRHTQQDGSDTPQMDSIFDKEKSR